MERLVEVNRRLQPSSRGFAERTRFADATRESFWLRKPVINILPGNEYFPFRPDDEIGETSIVDAAH
jgi:hypothetical protein